MLALTQVSADKLYKSDALPPISSSKRVSTREVVHNQKLLTELNSQFLQHKMASEQHLIETKNNLERFQKQYDPRLSEAARKHRSYRQAIKSCHNRVSEIHDDIVAAVKGKSNDLDLKLQSLFSKGSTEIALYEELANKTSQQVDGLSSMLLERIVEVQDGLKGLNSSFENIQQKVSKSMGGQKSFLRSLDPRIRDGEAKSFEIETLLHQLTSAHKALSQIVSQIKVCNKQLRHLEREGVGVMINEGFSKVFKHLAETSTSNENKVNDIDRNAETLSAVNKQMLDENDTINAHVDSLSVRTGENNANQSLIETELKDSIDETAARLYDEYFELFDEMRETRAMKRKNRWKSELSITRNAKHLSNVASDRASRLSDDWQLFFKNNQRVQADIDKSVESFTNKSGLDSESISKRIDNAYQKILWCLKRVTAWQRGANVETDVAEQQIAESEPILHEIEKRLKAFDNQRSSILPYKEKDIGAFRVGKPPKYKVKEERIEANMPDVQLTYSEDRLEELEKEGIPELPDFSEEDFEDYGEYEENDMFIPTPVPGRNVERNEWLNKGPERPKKHRGKHKKKRGKKHKSKSLAEGLLDHYDNDDDIYGGSGEVGYNEYDGVGGRNHTEGYYDGDTQFSTNDTGEGTYDTLDKDEPKKHKRKRKKNH